MEQNYWRKRVTDNLALSLMEREVACLFLVLMRNRINPELRSSGVLRSVFINSIPTFRDNLSVSNFKGQVGT